MGTKKNGLFKIIFEPDLKKPVLMNERLTKQDSDLFDYARGLGMRTTSKNSQPQVLIKTKDGWGTTT